MKLLSRTSPLLIGGVLLPVILVGALYYAFFRPLHVGDFTMPNLSGWKRTFSRSTRRERVVYTKMGGNSVSTIELSWQFNRGGFIPQTVQDLMSEAQKGIETTAPQRDKSGGVFQQGQPHQVSLNGISAVQSETTLTGSGGTMRSKSIRFLDHSKYYILNTSITSLSSSAITPAKQAEVDEGLSEITKSLAP